MIILIDNYDSFTYNLVHYFGELGAAVEVYRNDKITTEEIAAKNPSAIVISSGPSTPDKAGVSLRVIERFAGKIPILGVSLGHLCIAQAFGARIVPAKKLMHGKTSQVYHSGSGLYAGVPSPFSATRYHSLIVDRDSIGEQLIITSETDSGEVMGIRHREFDVEGFQFHPESILTQWGHVLLANFMRRVGLPVVESAARPRDPLIARVDIERAEKNSAFS